LPLQIWWHAEGEQSLGVRGVVRKVGELGVKNGWSDGVLLRNYVFPSLFAKDTRKDFYKKAAYLKLFVKNNKKQQKMVLYCVEKLCKIIPDTIKFIPSLLNGLYEQEVLDEEILIQWYKHPIDPSRLDPKISKAIRGLGMHKRNGESEPRLGLCYNSLDLDGNSKLLGT